MLPSQISHPGCHTSSFHRISSHFSLKFLPVLVVESPIITPSSCCTALSPSHCADWLPHHLSSVILLLHQPTLSSSHRASSRRAMVLYSHCPALSSFRRSLTTPPSHHSSSHRTGWLLHRLSSLRCRVLLLRRPLVILTSSHCATLSTSQSARLLLCGSLLTKFLPVPPMQCDVLKVTMLHV